MVGDQRIVIVGRDELALAVCAELAGCGRPVVVLAEHDEDLAARTQRCGGAFARQTGDERESLLAAGVLEASVIIALTEHDPTNLTYALSARAANPGIRIVLRQFNRTLGRKIEQNLNNSAVVSLSTHAAATYAAAAMDRTCYRGVQFPDIDGPIAGFYESSAARAGVEGLAARDVEAKLGRRLLAVGGDVRFERERVLAGSDRVTTFGPVLPRRMAGARAGLVPRLGAGRAVRAMRRLDPVAARTILLALTVFALGAAFFAHALRLDPLTAAYFAITTMTTTGYGDISPRDAGRFGIVVAMGLMIGGLAFGGIFVAMLSATFTQARYDAVQGLRRIESRGHVIVCGAGNVGSRVLEFLVRLGCRVVLVELAPRPDIVEGSRERRYELLTGDASRDATLDLCNVDQCVAVVALTNSDTMNLEVALGVRARASDATLPVVMRVQHETFERSVRDSFGFKLTYGTAPLAAPAFAGLAFDKGARGRVGIGGSGFDIFEIDLADGELRPPTADGIALAAWRNGSLKLLERFDDAKPGDRVLYLMPLARARHDVRSTNDPNS